MKQYIEITNNGEIEIAGLTLMGACTKTDNQIGFFGTGNKYAIATLMRNKVDFRIYSGINHFELETREVKFRDEIFHQVIIDGQTTSITTEMGPSWEPWFVLREFISNAIDEGRYKLNIVDEFNPEIGLTKIYIELDEEYEEIMSKFNNYFLDRSSVLDSTHKNVEIVQGDGSFNIFRRNISVTEYNGYKSLYWYNFNKLNINESRIFKYSWEIDEGIAKVLSVSTNKEIIENYLLNNKKNYEENANFYYAEKFSNTWLEVLEGKLLYLESIVRDSDEKDNVYLLKDNLGKKLAEQFPQLKIVGVNTKNYKRINIDTTQFSLNVNIEEDIEPVVEEMTQEEEEKIVNSIKESIESLSNVGYEPTFNLELVKSENKSEYWFNNETLFMDITEIKNIELALMYGYFMSKGYQEYSREFETMLISELISYGKKLLEINR